MASLPASDRGQKKKRIVTLALMAIFLMSASYFLIERKEETIIIVSFPNGREIETEVADTPEKLLVGLAFREALPANSGMLYIFESTGQNHIWTKEYRFPVDMIWVDESHHIVGLKETLVVVTADHSTSSALKAHTAEPVPILMCGEGVRKDNVKEFGERSCMNGGLHRMKGINIMPEIINLMGKAKLYGA